MVAASLFLPRRAQRPPVQIHISRIPRISSNDPGVMVDGGDANDPHSPASDNPLFEVFAA
jgi:hypothetical protein